MKKPRDRIPDEVLKEIFPRKLKSVPASEWVYTKLEKMILGGKFKKGKRLVRGEIAGNFDVGEWAISKAFSKLKKEGLIISNGRKGSFVV